MCDQIEKTLLSIMFTLFDIGCRCSFAFLFAAQNDPVAQTPNMFSDGRWVRATEFRLLSRMPESLFVGHYLATTKVSNKEQQILCTRETCLGSTLRDHLLNTQKMQTMQSLLEGRGTPRKHPSVHKNTQQIARMVSSDIRF